MKDTSVQKELGSGLLVAEKFDWAADVEDAEAESKFEPSKEQSHGGDGAKSNEVKFKGRGERKF